MAGEFLHEYGRKGNLDDLQCMEKAQFYLTYTDLFVAFCESKLILLWVKKKSPFLTFLKELHGVCVCFVGCGESSHTQQSNSQTSDAPG